MITGVLLTPSGAADPLDRPLPPMALHAEADEGGTVLQWEPPAAGEAVTGYRVYRLNETQREILGSVGGETLSFLDVEASPDYLYAYYVTAMSRNAESAPSNTAIQRYPHCYEIVYSVAPFVSLDCLFPLPIGPTVTRLVLG